MRTTANFDIPGIIVDRNTLVGYGVFLSGYKALTAISLRWGERQFSGLYYGTSAPLWWACVVCRVCW